MQPNTKTFNNIYHATLELADKFRTHTWRDSNRSIEECEAELKSLAIFIDDGKANEADKRDEAREKTLEGTWFRSTYFRRLIVHLQLEEAINGRNFQLEQEILGHTMAYLSNGTYYEVSSLSQIMEAAGQLYAASKKADKLYAPALSEDTKVLIESTKNLIKAGYSFQIVIGEPEFDADSEQRLIDEIERRVKELGGMYVIRQLFAREIYDHYHEKLGRYLICRNKISLGERRNIKVRIPYQYLLQLSLKYLKTESIFMDSYKERRYQELIRLAQDYLEVLQIQGYRTWEDVFTEIEDFPYKLAKNLCFEKMCIPRQYHPEYVKLLLQNMLEPYYGTGKEKMRAYSFHNYQELAVYVMQEARGPRIFKREEFADRLGISSYKLDQILQDVAYDADSINVDFSYYLDATNSWRKPLVRLDADTYFCLDGRMEGYAFYEAMFQIIFARYGTVFSKYQGERLEKMVYQMFQEKHFPYITGQYLPVGDLPERNCDMILEGSERVMFVEIKKCPLPGSYEQADDVDVLKTLGEGMLYAQEQILWHKLRLKEKGALVLYDKERNYLQDYTPGKKKIIAMSICMPEYDFLTDRMMTETFLESTLRVTYHAIDPSREKVLNKLNKRAANIQMVTARLFAGEKYTTRDVFFDSMFRSLQQVWTMLRMCDSLDMFLDMCDTQLVVITGAGDVYVDILSALHLHQSRSNKSLV
ncbi:hypothetical protein DXB01_08195 [Clostridium sp. OF10-22XD]|nr:hypothetical protein DXB01_08195 [Clostridium sp. OF10-22XD]